MCATTRPPQCRITVNRARRAFPALCHTSLPCSNPEELEALRKGEKRENSEETNHSPFPRVRTELGTGRSLNVCEGVKF